MMQSSSKAMNFGPYITTPAGALPAATQGSPYSVTLTATQGYPPFTGVILSQTGTNSWSFSGAVLTGTPANAETDTLLFRMVDSLGIPTAPVAFSVTVSALPVAATPTFSPIGGTYSVAQSVTLSCSTPSSAIYFTVDGSTPTYPVTGTTQLYTTPVNVAASETIKAIGVAAGYSNSAIGSAAYVIGAGNGPAIFTTGIVSALPNLVTGAAYSTQLVPSQGVGPWNTFTLVNYSNDIPSASTSPTTPINTITVSTTGVLASSANISATVENLFFLVSYKDSTAAPFTQNFAAYNAANHLKIITPSKLGYITQGNTYTSGSPLATIQAAGNAGSVTWSITAQTTSGATNNTWAINSSTGAITGTATNTGVNTLTVQAFDGTNTTTEFYNIGVYDYVTGAPRPSYNPSSGLNSQGIPCGPGFFVRANGEIYEGNGTLFRPNHGWAASYPNDITISHPRYASMGGNLIRITPDSNGESLSGETTEVNAAIAQHTNFHRVCMHGRWFIYSGTQISGNSSFATMGSALTEWVGAYASLYSAQMNNMMCNIANEYGPYSAWGVNWLNVYQAVSAPITALTSTTLSFSGTSPFNATNAGGGIGVVYIKGATWSGTNNDGLYAVSANATNSLTGTFMATGYVSGGTVWAGAIGVLRAAGFYCPLVLTASGGDTYADIINYGPTVQASDPLSNCIMDYHAYYTGGLTGDANQAGFESAICAPMNTNKITHGVPWVIGECGIYYPDGRAGSPVGGVTTTFPTYEYLQSTNKYGIGIMAWVSYIAIPTADTTQGFAFYKPSSSLTDASDAGYPGSFSVYGKRIVLHPVYGSVVSSTGGATSF
jgi:hypothetical protein